MTELHSIDAPRPNHSTGPNVVSTSSTKTPEGKKVCALNAYSHGLTGQLNIFTPDEQQAYDNHSKITLAALAPANDYERDLAQSIADDRWRLKRARTIESGMFAYVVSNSSTVGMQNGADAGNPQVDDALAQSRTWMKDSRNLQLLTLYEQRLRRAVAKAVAELKSIQTERELAVKEDMRQAKLLMQLAQAEGKPYQPEAYFSTAPPIRESVFSTPEVARELTRQIHLDDATRHWVCSPQPTRETLAKALACDSQVARALAGFSL